MGKIPHYRIQCISQFEVADPGSVNLQEFSESFANGPVIDGLRRDLNKALKGGISLESSERIGGMIRELEHETMRALFPYRFVNYGTSIFGSARLSPDDSDFKQVVAISRGLAEASRIDILTGGGPGVMEAANQGGQEAKEKRKKKKKRSSAKSTGMTVKLPFEENPNKHLDSRSHHGTFGTRLNEFADRSNSTVSWVGGAGTDLENSFIFQLRQVGHLESDYPIILQRETWESIQRAKERALFHDRVAARKTPLISPQDLSLVTFADHPDDVVQAVLDHYSVWKKRVWDKLDGESQEMLLAA